MHIHHVTLNSPHIAGQRDFFEQVLGLPIEFETATAITIQAGTSQISFLQSSDHHPYHYAFDIPENQFAGARQWLAERVGILADCNGVIEIHHRNINAHALYFKDADGNIVEFIARHNLPTARVMPFTQQSILRISEVGIVTPHVIKTVTAIKKQTGLKPFIGVGSETFTAVGDAQGMLIVVSKGRIWLPTRDVFAAPAPLEVVLAGAEAMSFPDLPYVIHTADAVQIQQVE